ncbi:hypothetical protein BV22DRAFT_482759 [Leucogyrophana mollusca]|uniref:Uncharacterized protein n=1 Tax=Leucogyrophana mollusca TaxID=85980 RepID=A0ACB8BH20_9AGAM|nr:hypothetical protein BV22DRAFT_482759 [Leucogyrophana mollusca]
MGEHIWDAQDDAIFAVPAQLLLKCANLGKAEFDPGAAPDVYCVELRCYTAGRKSPHSHQPRLPVFSTCYSGAMVPNLTRNGPPAVLDDKRGVHIEQTWHPTMDKDGVWGWYVRVWMPIPMGIFDKMETRLFKVDAKVWIDEAGDEEKAFEAGAEFTLSNLLKGRIMGPGMTMSGRLV